MPHFDFHPLAFAVAVLLLAACSSTSNNSDETRHRGEPTLMFQRLDANQDGLLSWDEFKDAPSRNRPAEELFKNLDTDSDGVVTRDEFMNMRQGGPDGQRGQRRMR